MWELYRTFSLLKIFINPRSIKNIQTNIDKIAINTNTSILNDFDRKDLKILEAKLWATSQSIGPSYKEISKKPWEKTKAHKKGNFRCIYLYMRYTHIHVYIYIYIYIYIDNKVCYIYQ